MLALQEAIKLIIERYIVGKAVIDDAVPAGATTIPVLSSRRFRAGEEVAIYNQSVLDATGEGEVGLISCIPEGFNAIELCEPIGESYSANDSFVEKLIGGKFLEGGVHIGDPAKNIRYPMITVNATEKSNEWLTLESTGETFNLDISVYVLAADYEESYRLMHTYIKKIETAMFRSLYPLVQPYDQVTLLEDIDDNDTIFRVVEPTNLPSAQMGWIWFESNDFLRPGKVIEIISEGVYRLSHPLLRSFAAGDHVIRPRRHFYDSFPRGIQYGTINQETAVLKAAVLSYKATEEVRRGTYIDPLTF